MNTQKQLKNIAFEVANKFSEMNKHPMLIVAANVFTRERLGFDILKNYDVYLFLYPNSNNAYVLSALAMSRTKNNQKPTQVWVACQDAVVGLEECLKTLKEELKEEKFKTMPEKMNSWYSLWVYRSRKLSLKDVINLEKHSQPLKVIETKKQKTILSPFRLVIGGLK